MSCLSLISGLSETCGGWELEVLSNGVSIQLGSSAAECSGQDYSGYDRLTREQVSVCLIICVIHSSMKLDFFPKQNLARKFYFHLPWYWVIFKVLVCESVKSSKEERNSRTDEGCSSTVVCIFSMLIVLHTFPKVLTKRICLAINNVFSWWSFSLFSWPLCVIQGRHCEEKFSLGHSWELQG